MADLYGIMSGLTCYWCERLQEFMSELRCKILEGMSHSFSCLKAI